MASLVVRSPFDPPSSRRDPHWLTGSRGTPVDDPSNRPPGGFRSPDRPTTPLGHRAPMAAARPSRVAGCAAPDRRHRGAARTTGRRRRPHRRHASLIEAPAPQATHTPGRRDRRSGRHRRRGHPRPSRPPAGPTRPDRSSAPARLHGAPSPGTSGTPGRHSKGSTPPGARRREAPVAPRRNIGADGPGSTIARLARPRTR